MQVQKVLVVAVALMLTLGSFGLAGVASAQSDPDPTTMGPQVGETVPDFTLQDHRGETRSLASLYGPRGLMLVFSRSADW